MSETSHLTQLYMQEASVIFHDWLLLRGLSPETFRGYSVDSRQFTKWITSKEDDSIGVQEITSQHIEEFMRYLMQEKKCKPSTVNRKLNTLRMFFRWLLIR